MRIISWNVNGLRAAVNKGFNTWLISENADIICLQEIKANPDQVNIALFPNPYKHTICNSATKAGYSGVAILSKHKPIKTFTGLGDETCDSEGRLLINEYAHFFLVNVYCPSATRSGARLAFKLYFYELFFGRVLELQKTGKAVIFCGDLNIAHTRMDLANPKSNKYTPGFLPRERAWLDKFVENGFTDSFRHLNKSAGHYSWWTYRFNARERNIGWRLDYIFLTTKDAPSLKNAYILKSIKGSDHCPVGIDIIFDHSQNDLNHPAK